MVVPASMRASPAPPGMHRHATETNAMPQNLRWSQSSSLPVNATVESYKSKETLMSSQSVAGLESLKQFRVVEESPGYWRATFLNPPVNLYDPQTFLELKSLWEKTEQTTDVKVVVFDSADPDYFISHYDLVKAAQARTNRGGARPAPDIHSDGRCSVRRLSRSHEQHFPTLVNLTSGVTPPGCGRAHRPNRSVGRRASRVPGRAVSGGHSRSFSASV